MAGVGTVTLQIQAPDRATWDTFKTKLTAFAAAHPEISLSHIEYVETG